MRAGERRKTTGDGAGFAASLAFATTERPRIDPIAATPTPPQIAMLEPRSQPGLRPSQSIASPIAVSALPAKTELATTNHPHVPSVRHDGTRDRGADDDALAAGGGVALDGVSGSSA